MHSIWKRPDWGIWNETQAESFENKMKTSLQLLLNNIQLWLKMQPLQFASLFFSQVLKWRRSLLVFVVVVSLRSIFATTIIEVNHFYVTIRKTAVLMYRKQIWSKSSWFVQLGSSETFHFSPGIPPTLVVGRLFRLFLSSAQVVRQRAHHPSRAPCQRHVPLNSLFTVWNLT